MRRMRITSASYAQMGPLFELCLVANANAGALKHNRTIALKLLQRALYNFTHRPHHGCNLLMRDMRTSIRRLLDDMLMLSHTAEKQPRHPGGNVSQRQIFDDGAERSLAR